MNNINILADIARNNGFENSLNESDLYSNLKEEVASLNTVNEEVIHGDISIIPVHDITETFAEYNFNTDILDESVIADLKSKIRGKSIEAIEKDIKSFDDGIKKTREQLKELKSKTDDKSEKLKTKLNKQLTELTESRKGLVQALKQKKAKQAANESYAVTVDSLVEVAEAMDITLAKAMNMIKESNEIGEDVKVLCVLPEGINEYTTVEEFCEIIAEFNENNIDVAWNSELVCEDFITEAAKFSDIISKLKEKIKKDPVQKIEKIIKNCEENNKKLNEEMDKVNKMSKEDALKYCKKQSVKNIVILTALLSGLYAGTLGAMTLVLYRPFLTLTAFGFGITGMSKLIDKVGNDGTAIGFSVSSYKAALRNTIKMNNETIKECKIRLKDEK